MVPVKNVRIMLMAVILCSLTLSAYLPTVLRSDFVTLDDTLLITKNSTIQELTPRSVWKAFTSYDPELYVPLTLITYQVEYALAGLTPQVYHFHNLLLHAGSVLLLFLFASMLLRSTTAGFFVALLFALHPLNVEAVAWAAARKDVLSTFFLLLTLWLYEHGERYAKPRYSRWSVFTFALALLSKVTVLALPLLLPLLALMRGEKLRAQKLKRHWPFWALSIAFALIAYIGKTRNLGNLSLFDYALVGSKSVVFYLSKIFWPTNFSVSYHQVTEVTILTAEFFLPVVLVMLLLAATLWMLWKRWMFPACSLLFFFFTVSVNFFNVWKNGMLFFGSDRYAYIPSIGIFLLLGFFLTKIFPYVGKVFGKKLIPAFDLVLAGFLILLLLPLTLVQAAVWENSESLYKHALAVSPASVMVLNNLGDLYVDEGKVDQGMQLFLEAVKSDPKNIVALTNIGNLYKKSGDLQKAKEFYAQAADVVPTDPFPEHLMGLYLLGELQIETGKTQDGLESLAKAVRLGSMYAEPYFNLGLMLEKQGRKDDAIQVYAKGVEVNGEYLIARYHLANLLAERGDLAGATEQLSAIVQRNPKYEKAAEHLANIRAMMQP